MVSFHNATFELFGTQPRTTTAALGELQSAEQRLGIRLPPSVREWYSYENALSTLAEHSNADPPIPVSEFTLTESPVGRLIPIRWENQGVCTWAVLLDGSDDPPVFVDVDSGGTKWQRLAETFSIYVYTCVWDYHVVFGRPGLVQAQNGPISSMALKVLANLFIEGPRTFGWPGSVQHRFTGSQQGILIWSTQNPSAWYEHQSADWFVGAADSASLESALGVIWDLDEVGKSFYGCSDIAKKVLAKLKADS